MSEPIREVEAAVAELGALPMPVGPESKQVDVEDQREQAEAWEGHILGAWGGKFAMETGLDRAVLRLARMLKADVSELVQLRARVAELEAQREADHKTWQHDLSTARSEREAMAVRVADLEATVRLLNTQRGDVSLLIERERGCGQDCVDSGDVEEALGLGSDEVDGITQRIAPTQVLSLEDPHDSPLHRTYKVAHDLPPIGGAPC